MRMNKDGCKLKTLDQMFKSAERQKSCFEKVIKEVKIVKEAKIVSDGLWRFVCGNVFS